jgi:hypothetical protein
MPDFDEEWVAVNLRSPFLPPSHRAGMGLTSAGWGRVLFVSSAAACS